MAEKNFFDDSNLGRSQDDTSLAALQQQIQQHEKQTEQRGLLTRAVALVWHKDDDSLDQLKELEKKAKATNGAGFENQIRDGIAADRKAVASENDVLHYATGFVKTVPLFMSGKGMMATTIGLYALDQINPNDSAGTMIADGLLGAAKGGLTKYTFDTIGAKESLDPAGKGLLLGTTSRLIDQGLTRQTYLNPTDGSLSLTSAGSGLKSVVSNTLNPTALVTDVAVFGIGHGLFKAGNALTDNMLARSPLLSNMGTGFSFGMTGGATAEIQRQRQTGEAFDPVKIVSKGLLQGSLDAVAAAPGGLASQYGQGAAHLNERTILPEKNLPVQRVETSLTTKISGVAGGDLTSPLTGASRVSFSSENSGLLQSQGITPGTMMFERLGVASSGPDIAHGIASGAHDAPNNAHSGNRPSAIETPGGGGGEQIPDKLTRLGLVEQESDHAVRRQPVERLEVGGAQNQLPYNAQLDLTPGARYVVDGHHWTVAAVDEAGNVKLTRGLTKDYDPTTIHKAQGWNNVTDFTAGESYRLLRTGGTEPEPGWIYMGGGRFVKSDAAVKTITPADYARVLEANPHGMKVGEYKIGDLVVMPGGTEKAQVVGFDGGLMVLYRPAREGKYSEIRHPQNFDNYRKLDIEGESDLYAHNNGKIYKVTKINDELISRQKPQYEFSSIGGMDSPARVGIQFKVGDPVRANSITARLAGFDPATGDAIVFYPALESAGGATRHVADLKGLSEIQVQGVNIYRDRADNYWTAVKLQNGGYELHETKAYDGLPQAQIRPAKLSADASDGNKAVDVRPLLPDEVRPKIPDAPRAVPGQFNMLDGYKGAELNLNGQVFATGDVLHGAPLKIGRDALGMSDSIYISTKHADLRWVPEQQMFYYADHSTNGTYIRRSGTSEYIKIKGTEKEPAGIYIGPGDEIRLGKKDGAELKLSTGVDTPSGVGTADRSRTDTQVFFDGKEISMSGQQVIVGRKHQDFGNGVSDVLNRRVSNDHVKLSKRGDDWYVEDLTKADAGHGFGEHRTVLVNQRGSNGTYIVHADGKETFVQGREVKLLPGDKVYLGARNGPELKLVTTEGTELSDGRIELKRQNGDTVYRRPDGTVQVVDKYGMSHIEDTQGRVIQVMNMGDGMLRTPRTFEYDDDNALKKISFADNSTVTSTDGKNWVRTKSDGTSEHWWTGSIEVEPDGGLKYSDGFKPPRVTIERPDGSREVVDQHGRIDYQNVDFYKELAFMNSVRDSYTLPAQRGRFKDLMNEFEMRSQKDGLSREEMAKTFHQVRRLLQAGDGAILSAADRAKLAEQVLYQAAHPESIDQGANNTCNVTTVEKRVFARNPSEAARLIADVALTGKYVTADGVTVDLSRVPGALSADAEARQLDRNFDSKNRDIKVDGARSRASQIFEIGAVNIKYAKQHSSSLSSTVVYEKPESGLKGQEKEQLVRYGVDFTGKLSREVLKDSPDISIDELRGIHNEIVGGNEGGFVIMGPKYMSRRTRNVYNAVDNYGRNNPDVMVAESQQDLGKLLFDLQGQKKLPAILYVDAKNTFFGGSGGGSGGGGHVINIQRIFNQGGRTMVEFTNQWGSKDNRTVTLDVLYGLTLPPGVK